MSDITVNFANEYGKNIQLLVTTPTGEFDGKCAEGTITGAENLYWEQLGGAAENEVTEANGQQVYRNLEHFRRKVFTADYELPLMLDKRQEMRAAVDFKSSYVQRTAEAYKRSKTIEAIKSFYNPAYTGKNGTDAVNFDYTNQSIGVGVGAASGFTTAGLTKEKLIATLTKLRKAGYTLNTPKYKPYFACSQDELANLLLLVETTSRDYTDLLALQTGMISNWLGFEFIFTEMLPWTNTAINGVQLSWDVDSGTGVKAPVNVDSVTTRGCFAYVKENIGMYSSQSFQTEAGKIERFRYNWGLYASWSHGGVRREEKGGVFVPCDTVPQAE